MKKSPWSFCAFCIFAVLLNACTTTSTTSNHSTSISNDAPDPIEIPPRRGMTKAQVVAQYGEPRAVNVTDRGEMWVYLLNGGEIAGKALIPFYPPVRPRFGRVFFGRDDRVTDFNWQPDPHA